MGRVRSAAPRTASNPFQRAQLEALYLGPLPGTAPLFERLVPGVDDEVWVELYDEDPAAAKSFLVIDRTGQAKGRVTLPVAVTLFESGRDYVLGVRRDDDGLEHIVQFSLRR